VLDQLAALRCYRAKGTTKVAFESLSPELQQPFRDDATAILESLNKLNLMCVPKVSPEQAEATRTTRLNRCLARAEAVVTGVKVWKKPMFPLRELVLQILEEADTQ